MTLGSAKRCELVIFNYGERDGSISPIADYFCQVIDSQSVLYCTVQQPSGL